MARMTPLRRKTRCAVIGLRSRETLEACESKPSQALETRFAQSYYPGPLGSGMRHRKLRIRGNEMAAPPFQPMRPQGYTRRLCENLQRIVQTRTAKKDT